MAKTLSSESPSSAVASDLVEAASACIAPPESKRPRSDESSRPSTVRREFAIPPELDELLGFQLVPALRRATGLPVNRSTVIRALLLLLSEEWSRSARRFSSPDFSGKNADEAVNVILAELLAAAGR